jgi:hypothetical protein
VGWNSSPELSILTRVQWQIALSGVIPALVAMWLVDRLDAKRPEPARLRRMVAFAGMLSVFRRSSSRRSHRARSASGSSRR